MLISVLPLLSSATELFFFGVLLARGYTACCYVWNGARQRGAGVIERDEAFMRKLRRLPWRIPKSNHGQQQPPAAKAAPQVDIDRERELQREREREMQPVAFAGGRYVYGACPAPQSRQSRPTEIRRKTRHRVMPLPVPAI